MSQPSIIAIRPGVKLSARDRRTLREVGVVVIEIDPADIRAVEHVSILPHNDMLRLALETIESVKYEPDRNALRADLARRMIASLLALGEGKS